MEKKRPFRLWFGKFKNRHLEQMMFDPQGYLYIVEFILGVLPREPRYWPSIFHRTVCFEQTDLYLVARALRELGEQVVAQALCSCGQPAIFFSCGGNEQIGYNFQCAELYCQECRKERWFYEKGQIFRLNFSTISRFRSLADRRNYLRLLRVCLGFNQNERLTIEKAAAFFDTQAEREAIAVSVKKEEPSSTLIEEEKPKLHREPEQLRLL